MLYVFSYNRFSNSARELARGLGVKRIKLTDSRFKPSGRKTVINWGSSRLPDNYEKCRILNSPEKIARCSNKLTFFKYFSERSDKLPPFTTDHAVVREWLENKKSVCVRSVLQGHSGEGLSILDCFGELDQPIPDAPLYTQYIKKKEEFRVHFVNNRVVCVQRKALRTDDGRPEEPNFQIRNHDNGFVFTRNEEVDEVLMRTVTSTAYEVFRLSELDFGAVDVVYNSKHEKAYVLEINTAPGLVGSTINDYVEAFKEYL